MHRCHASAVLPVLSVALLAVVSTGCGSMSGALRSGTSPIADVASAIGPADRAPQSEGTIERGAVDCCSDSQVIELVETSEVTQNADVQTADVCASSEEPVGSAPDLATLGTSSVAFEGVASVPDSDVPLLLAATGKDSEEEIQDYDPWEPFNERVFDFNYKLDRYVLKPVAKAWDKVVPDEIQRMISSAFDNLGAPRRLVNSVLQGKWAGAGREVARFLINTTIGFGGLWDMAHKEWGIEKSNEDFGQTLGVYGAGAGPYLVLPFLDPMTVRDGIGRGVDSLLEPLGWLIPFWQNLVLKVVNVVDERSLNLELFQGFEETVVDLYSAVRHAYLERRQHLVKE